MLLEQSMGPFIAAVAYVLCALNGNVASATTHSASVNSISGSKGWHRSSLPSFISAKKSTFHWTDNVLSQTRGGSDEEEGAITAVAEAEEGAAAPAADDDDDVVTPIDSDDATEAKARNLTFSATKPYDGSPEDPDGIPSRFLNMKKGDREGAKEAFEGHLSWREENDVDTVLSRPHPQFDVCKAMAPHYFAGHDVKGNIVFVQRPAMLDFELMRKNNATIDDLLNHYIYVIEYCWNILEDGPPEGVMTNVLDMSGLSFRSMKNQEYIGFGKKFVNMMSSNYPGRSYKTLIVNAPKWFHGLFKLFKPLLREATRKKIVILKAGKHQEKILREILGDSLPNDLISGNDAPEVEAGARFFLPTEEKEECEPGPNSLIEFEMRQFCIELLKLNNETMQEVI
mmetsp:Transcript_24667/g.51622  ORF Transcript_24667/g.51622 Transcript_24667/m.51622 type:complete len:398 (-) Transcript_24667:996-2189(-)